MSIFLRFSHYNSRYSEISKFKSEDYMDVSKKILDKYELLQHEYLKDTGCDSLLLRHKKTGARVALYFK